MYIAVVERSKAATASLHAAKRSSTAATFLAIASFGAAMWKSITFGSLYWMATCQPYLFLNASNAIGVFVVFVMGKFLRESAGLSRLPHHLFVLLAGVAPSHLCTDVVVVALARHDPYASATIDALRFSDFMATAVPIKRVSEVIGY
jgi:hypothetical protein